MEDNNNIFSSASLKDGFAGDRRYLKGFLAKINLIFLLYPDRYQDDETKVIYLISRLYGNAMNWAATLIDRNDPCLTNYEAFVGRLKAFYGSNDTTYIANQKLRTIRQHRLGSIQGYIQEFNKYSDDSNWNEQAKMDAFTAGLNQQVAVKILEMFPGPQDLISLQTIAARIDSRISTHANFFSSYNQTTSSSRNRKSNTRNNKNVTKTKSYNSPLSKEEKERRKKENLCLYCGSPDHSIDGCPKRKAKESRSSTFMSSNTTKPCDTTHSQKSNNFVVTFKFNGKNSSDVLIDSGSAINLIDKDFCKRNKIHYTTDRTWNNVVGIGGNQTIFGKTTPISISYKNHLCKTTFYVTNLPIYNCILGLEWLETHNPDIDFSSKDMSFNSKYCNTNCVILTDLNLTNKTHESDFSNTSNTLNKSINKSNNPNSFSVSITDLNKLELT